MRRKGPPVFSMLVTSSALKQLCYVILVFVTLILTMVEMVKGHEDQLRTPYNKDIWKLRHSQHQHERRLQKMHLRQQRHRLLLHEVTQPRRSIREITGSAAIINQDLDSSTENITWPNKLSADTEGDIFLGGLHMIHERDHDKTCGPIMAQGGIQAMETMMFTIDHINQQPWWIPNVTLGALVLDDCDTDTYGLEQAVDFIKAWPDKRVAEIEGDILIGGLHMVHEREDKMICGPIMPQGGLQAAEVMLFTVDRVNELNIMPKGIRLGTYILDDCDKDTYGLQQAVDFIKGSITNIDDDAVKCTDGTSPEIRNKVISGVVGAASSVTSIQVANLLRLFKIPQISFFSTSPELSNKQRFEYFSRTIPSDHYQTMAMAKIVERLGWKYMSIIYEESNYGIKAFEELERLLSNRGICVAVKEKLTKDSGVAGGEEYNHIVEKLLENKKAKGVIIFGSDQEVAGLMRAVKHMNATGKFNWIGSDGWSARALVSDGNEAEVEGTLSVQPQANPVEGFEEYFLSLKPQTNIRNPWFKEFWEDHFNCRYFDQNGKPSLTTPYNKDFSKKCTGTERLTKENTQFEAQLQFVSDAVMAFAHAFSDMHRDQCGEMYEGLCQKMTSINGEVLLKFLRNVSFKGLTGDEFKFNQHGDGPARYNIIHYKQLSKGIYQWITVGNFYDEEMELNMDDIQFKLDSEEGIPESICSKPCQIGLRKKYEEGESCCWTCHSCGRFEILNQEDETRCKPCPNGTLPNSNHTDCVAIPEEYLRFTSYWAIGAISFALIGMVLASVVLVVFVRNNNTPVVRASGRELSYVLIGGLLLCYGITFILLQKPNNWICGIQEFMIGLCFSIVYGALLTKTNRIYRIFNASKHSAQKPTLISPKSQLIICSGIVFAQVIINVIWMLISPPEAIHHNPSREDWLLVCKASINASYMIAFSYPILLVIICTVYAVLTRKIPEAFNESKFIGFSMYTTCIIWLAFIPIYFTTGQHVALRITSMSITISLSATVTIVCLFTPKLYIILLHPEKNVRQSMMNKSVYQKTMTQSIKNGPGTVNNGEVVSNKKNLDNGSSMEVQQQRVPLITTQSKVQNGNSASNNATNTPPPIASCNCGASLSTNPNNTSSDLLTSKSPAAASSAQIPKPPSVLPLPNKNCKQEEVKESSATQTSPPTSKSTSMNNIDHPRLLQDQEVPPPTSTTNTIVESKEIGTQTKTQWLQISLNSPPLSLTQEVPDVAL